MAFPIDLNIPTLIIGAVTFWLMVKFMKRPKKSPPGPWGVPVFGCLLSFLFTRKRLRDVFKDWYYKYGPIYSVKMGSAYVVVLNNIESIHDALIRPEFQDRVKMDFMLMRKGEGIALSNGKVWQEQRKFIHQIFRDFGIGKASFEDAIVEEANFLTDALLQSDGKLVNIEYILNNAVSNIISSVSFGKRFEYDDKRFQIILKNFNENMEQSVIRFGLSVFLPFTQYIPFSGSKKIRDNVKYYINFHDEITVEHQAKFDVANLKDIIDAYLLEIKKSNNNAWLEVFNEDNMFWVIADLFSAGTDTTTTTLLWAFLFLLNNPEVEVKVRAQLDEVVGRNRMPRYSDRPKLPLVEAIISESLRLGTVSALSLPHVAAIDSELHGYKIPKGTIIIPNFHVLFTDEKKWNEPEKFNPERFLDKDGAYVKREDFIPFSTGRRLCIGEQLARMELFIFFTHILQKMSFSVPDGRRTPPPEGFDGFTHKPKAYEVLIKKCIAASNGTVWQEQRKFVHQIFRDFGVGKATFEDAIVEEANFLTNALLELDGKVVNIEHLLNNAVSNIVSSVSFGQRFEYDDKTFQNVLEKFNENMQKSLVQLSLSVFLPFTKYIPFFGSKRRNDNVKTQIRFHNEITTEHKTKFDVDNMKGIMDAYLLEMMKGSNKGRLEVFNEDNMFWVITDLFAAGTETTTTTLLWVFLFLLNNPGVEEEVRVQLTDVVGRNRMPRYSDRPKLPLVEAIISESLRVGTAATLSLPHVAANDSELHGYNIPKGTIIIPNFYALFTDKKKWDEPEKFYPQRFLDKNGNYVKRDDFIPFSTGRRLCIGEQLARMELFIFFTHILQKMSFSVPDGRRTPPPQGFDGFTHRPKAYEVLIRKCTE
ncbi:Cytochrome P450 2J6 [Holothuria leucospilota]|uniref:Cytochrome P450 2U1 n=1 Tax=Holothuria leucospilota TaxID=206669 RepID=A0A9Q1BMD5_HOLLE|nr:Cytochrome P450 2J6 [Holothuria leucospilota]